MQKLEKLRELVSDAKNVIEKGCSQWEFRLDSANFQTKSKDDFEKYRKVFEGDGLTLLMELSHASRKIRVYQIPENLKTEYAGLTYIELTGPKPGKKLERTEWEYVSFVIDDYDKFIQHGCKSPDEFNKVRKVGSSKFCYYADLNNRLQFRNKSISEAEEVELRQGEQAGQSVTSAEEKFTSGVGEIQKEREMRLKLSNLKSQKTKIKIYKTGDFFIISPRTLHQIKVLKQTKCLVLYSRRFSRTNPDICYK